MHHTTWNLTLKRMAVILKEVQAENNLTSIGLNIFPDNTSMPFTVYVHWNNGCKGANGATIQTALELALQEMRDEQRAEAQRETDDFERGNAAYAAGFAG